MKRKAFTLIELLAVIAIISILASILFPVFARARENARRAGCLSNMKQIGLGVMMYVQDYDEKYPPSAYDTAASDVSAYWFGFIQPYIKSTQVFQCPSSGSTSRFDRNYGANQNLFTYKPNGSSVNVVSMAAVASTSKTYMIMDYGTYEFAGGLETYVPKPKNANYVPGIGAVSGYAVTYWESHSSAPYKTNTIEDDLKNGRHFGGINIAFADGHAKWEKTATVYGQYNSTGHGAFKPENE
jgi:prepilin-type N-terminal cleavage/methylation domain-containing protein/prepilin-type processing-associated H-X9-DG protein